MKTNLDSDVLRHLETHPWCSVSDLQSAIQALWRERGWRGFWSRVVSPFSLEQAIRWHHPSWISVSVSLGRLEFRGLVVTRRREESPERIQARNSLPIWEYALASQKRDEDEFPAT